MRRMQINITDEQSQRISQMAAERGVPKAQVIRGILDRALNTGDHEAEAWAAILASAGVMSDAPDWPEWQRSARGRTAAQA
jgi:Antitoxin ParD